MKQKNGKKKHSHHNHHKQMIADFRKRFFFSLILTVPVMFLSPFIQETFGFNLAFTGDRWVSFGFATAIFFYGGWPFLKGFIQEMGEKNPGMMTLIALAITTAYIYSAAVTAGLSGKVFYWELATLVDIMLVGHWIEMKSVMSASGALQKLASLMPDEVHKKQGDKTLDVSLKEVEPEDILVIKPGEKIPADGVVTSGESQVDESMITGESSPVQRKAGDNLTGGSVNGDGSLEMEVSKSGEDSYLYQVIGIVKEAQEKKSRTQGLADKAAFWLTIIAVSAGIATLLSWLLLAGRDLQFSLARMATVMVITCPHALGLAIPLVSAVSTTESAQNGFIIRNRTAFENSRKITAVVFDKTGTLTTGNFVVSHIEVLDQSYSPEDLMKIAGGLEKQSEHPLAKGVMDWLENKNLNPAETKDFQYVKGKGLEGSYKGKSISLTNLNYLKEKNRDIPSTDKLAEGTSNIFVTLEEKVIGYISFNDRIRSESYEAVKKLQQQGIKCLALSGDNESAVKHVSEELGLDGYYAEVLPHDKQKKIEKLEKNGEFVAMAGDGVNDAPALASASMGIAIGSGTDVAVESADIILVNSNPEDISSVITFGRKTYNKIVQNLFWATGYNVVAIPLAAGVLSGAGIILSPAVGAVLMSFSTVIVAINARLLSLN